MEGKNSNNEGIKMKLKNIIASTFLLALLSGCSVNGDDAEESKLEPSHASYIPTKVVVGSESAKSYFSFEIKSDILPDKRFVIYSDDFREKKSFSLCPKTPEYSCESHIQILRRSNNQIQASLSIKYLDALRESPYETGPEKILHYDYIGYSPILINIGEKLELKNERDSTGTVFDGRYVTYQTK